MLFFLVCSSSFLSFCRYRYTLDELCSLVVGLKKRAECYDVWLSKAQEALEAKADNRFELEDVKEMLAEALDRKYPETDIFNALTITVEEGEKCQTVANQVGSNVV